MDDLDRPCTCPGPTMIDLSCPVHGDYDEDNDWRAW